MSKAPPARAAWEPAARRRPLVTPEGVELGVEVAAAGERASAFLIDALIMVGILVAFTVAIFLTAFALRRSPALELLEVLWLLGFFLLRNAWFLAFELGPRAATPGKRAVKLRVASRSGGRLTADAVIARNAMREIEIFLPLTFLFINARGIDGWIMLFGVAWSGVFALFPLFNRDVLRVGDLVAGTWVVRDPRRKLVADLSGVRQDARFAFSPAQVDAYGVKELQLLEEVLRTNNRAAVELVAARIRAKIGWARRPDETDGAFLDAYYSALRKRLEARLLLGRRRRDKHDAG